MIGYLIWDVGLGEAFVGLTEVPCREVLTRDQSKFKRKTIAAVTELIFHLFILLSLCFV